MRIVDSEGYLPAFRVDEHIYINSIRFFKTPADGYFVKFKILLEFGKYRINLVNNYVKLNDLGNIVWHCNTEVDEHTYKTIHGELLKQEWVRTIGRGKARTPVRRVVETVEEIEDVLENIEE